MALKCEKTRALSKEDMVLIAGSALSVRLVLNKITIKSLKEDGVYNTWRAREVAWYSLRDAISNWLIVKASNVYFFDPVYHDKDRNHFEMIVLFSSKIDMVHFKLYFENVETNGELWKEEDHGDM